MIRHIVAWTLRTDIDRTQAVGSIREALEGLVGVVPSIRELHVVENIAGSGENADVAVVGTFDDVAGLEAYQVHPAHLAAAAVVREFVTSRSAIDWEN